MPTAIEDLRSECLNYIKNNVKCAVSQLKADVPNAISPGEGFTYDVSAQNTGLIPLTNVRYHLWVGNPGIAKLCVPFNIFGPPLVARQGPTPESPLLPPGARVTEMYLFATGDVRRLDPGETDAWRKLRGVAESLGDTQINFQIIAEVDEAFVIPPDVPSSIGQANLAVV